MMKCVLIYNPNSGKLTNRNDIKKLYRIFENYGYEVEIIYTEYKGHAKEITKKLNDVDLLICAGGDGTLNEVISGNIERSKPLLLGHLPLGSVNDVAHMYGLTGSTTRNLVMLLNGARKNIDVCLLNGNPFVYVACIGAWVDISYSTPRKLKEKYGKFAYAIYGIKQLKTQKLQFYNVKYTVNGETHEDRFSFIFITNSNRIGGVNNIYDDVKLDDNKFEVLLCDIKNKWDIIRAVHYLTHRKLEDIPVFKYFKTDKIELEFDETPPSWCIDGDELTHKSKRI
ncbi:MAG: YegS/Rv2252/BmrU family lipid kinase [Clostridium sp.]|nr:MAG: YegS/Rv2252/BmrU family lipid kinase [Clostridium sp.]